MPDRARLADLAEKLRALHHQASPLVLPNAWDAATAKLVVEAGFPVVATTSSGVAASLGWPDGEQTPIDEVFGALWRISRVIDVPLTADIEAGYGLTPEELVERLLEAGAVGCNLEDTDHAHGRTLRNAEEQAQTLAAVKRAATHAGVNIVLNARVDAFLRQAHGDAPPIEEAIRRGRMYLEAGADCVFPIGAPDEGTIAALVDGIPGPMNAIASFRGAPGLRRLSAMGVRRISYAGRLQHAALDEHRRRLSAIASGDDI